MTAEEAIARTLELGPYTASMVAQDILAALSAAGFVVVPKVAVDPSFEEKTAINRVVQERWDGLIREGKHGIYETVFKLVHEQRAAAVAAMLAAAQTPPADTPASGPQTARLCVKPDF